MPLRLLPLRLSDFETLIEHGSRSYPGDDLVAPPNPVTWPVATTAEAQTRLEYCMSMQRNRFLNDPTCHFLKVVDFPSDKTHEDDADIISVARWHHYPTGYKYTLEAAWEMATLPKDVVSGTAWPTAFNVKMHDFILTQRDSFREQWMAKGQPAWILMHLVTRPSRRGRGAAAMLIEWGKDRAAEGRAVAYLESGAAARSLYERHGFKQVGEIRHLNLEPFGLNVVFQLANMSWCAPAESIEEKSSKE